MDTRNQLSENTPAAPGFGLRKPAFGLSRERISRIELVLALRGGALVNVFEELGDEVNAERLDAYANELAEQIAGGKGRSFADAWSSTGQRSWINLGEVTAFTIRQAK